MEQHPGQKRIEEWFAAHDMEPFPYQRRVWKAFQEGKNGLLNAPTGSGKTYALWMPLLIRWINRYPDTYRERSGNGLRLLWITPLRALARDLERALREVANDLEIPWTIARRTGDISSYQKRKLKEQPPEVLVTTPESLHIMLAQKGYPDYFKNLEAVVVDEWHELLGSKRGTQTELGLARLRNMIENLQVWGISATIGNLDQAREVLLGPEANPSSSVTVKAKVEKQLRIYTLIPDDMDSFPWAGHLGIRLLDQVLPVIENSRSTLVFTNTRSQSEVWFQRILEEKPDLAGAIALHHGSLDQKIRRWVEQSLHKGDLKAVVCTSSLDLGVDFAPVETVIQVGSPKGIARFLQRAGRSGHQPGAVSRIFFVPTHALELVEAAALKTAARKKTALEHRDPVLKPYDVLVQYLVTLGLSEGFHPGRLYREVRRTFAYQALTEPEWNWILDFVTTGGKALARYDKYSKVETDDHDRRYRVTDRKIARRHRMSIGTITGNAMMSVTYMKGTRLGHIEEWFVAKLKPGQSFWFAGRSLELIRTEGMTAYVRRSDRPNPRVPRWMGGRMSLSSNMAALLREKIEESSDTEAVDKQEELAAVAPVLQLQSEWSRLPDKNELLIEKTLSEEGCHLFFYPFEGRYVHEGLAALVACRIARIKPITFSIAMNDFGFELLSEKEIPIEKALEGDLFSENNLVEDIFASLNDTEIAKRRFRPISQIAGLVFSGFPGRARTNRHLQTSSGLLFDVFSEYEPENLLLQQAYDEVLTEQLDEVRLRRALHRINSGKITLTAPGQFTPLAFPIMVDRLRERLSSETLKDRVKRMKVQLQKGTAL